MFAVPKIWKIKKSMNNTKFEGIALESMQHL
jgi:hypothetical protein